VVEVRREGEEERALSRRAERHEEHEERHVASCGDAYVFGGELRLALLTGQGVRVAQLGSESGAQCRLTQDRAIVGCTRCS
jgi:hypothetical protein